RLDESARKSLVGSVVDAARVRGGCELAIALGDRYPGDIGVVGALLLNRVRVAPGEAGWVPAGKPHRHPRGTGVAGSAASGNLRRGGLTPKHVDVPELLRVLRFEVQADLVVRPRQVAPGLVTWPTPVDDFVLYRAKPAGGRIALPGHGPRIVLCLRGKVR